MGLDTINGKIEDNIFDDKDLAEDNFMLKIDESQEQEAKETSGQIEDVSEEKAMSELNEIRDLIVANYKKSDKTDYYLMLSIQSWAESEKMRKIGHKSLSNCYLAIREKYKRDRRQKINNLINSITVSNFFNFKKDDISPEVVGAMKKDICESISDANFRTSVLKNDHNITYFTWQILQESLSYAQDAFSDNEPMIETLKKEANRAFEDLLSKLKSISAKHKKIEEEKDREKKTEQKTNQKGRVTDVDDVQYFSKIEEESPYKTRKLIRQNGKIVPKNIDHINQVLFKLQKEIKKMKKKEEIHKKQQEIRENLNTVSDEVI